MTLTLALNLKNGELLLNWACSRGLETYKELAKLLVEAGADVNIASKVNRTLD